MPRIWLPNERQRALIISSAKLGRLALQKGRPADARTCFEKSLRQSEAMLARDPSNRTVQSSRRRFLLVVGSSQLSVSVTCQRPRTITVGHWNCVRRCTPKIRQVCRRQATWPGRTMHWGTLSLQTDHTQEAQEFYESAVTLLEELYGKDPTNAAVKGSLSTLYYKLATTLLRLDDRKTAKPIYAKCLELREQLLSADKDDPNKQISVRTGSGSLRATQRSGRTRRSTPRESG